MFVVDQLKGEELLLGCFVLFPENLSQTLGENSPRLTLADRIRSELSRSERVCSARRHCSKSFILSLDPFFIPALSNPLP